MATHSAVEELDYGYSLLGSLRKDLRMLQGFGTVVQELIQNAEDARAETFWMDFTSEALRVGNSAEFEDSHFERIIHVASGSKRDDAESIGSFGVGFVSVYQVTDEPGIYSRQQARILLPLKRKARKLTGVSHEWPSTFILPWATQPSEVRHQLDVEPVDLEQLDTFVTQAQETFARSAVFLRNVRTLHLLREGKLVEKLCIEPSGPQEVKLVSSTGPSVRYRMYDVPVTEEVQREAQRRKRRTTLQLALPLGEESVSGLLYAFLPTRDTTGIPLHINADFYPNTDRKTLLWDEADKRVWNERLLECVVSFLPQLLLDLATSGPETLYTFAAAVRSAAARNGSSPHPVARFVGGLWKACQLTFKERPLFWSRSGEWVEHGDFLRIAYDADPVLEETLLVRTPWHLPPPEHGGYRALFRALGVPELNAETFLQTLEQLFGDDVDWVTDEQRRPLLNAIFAYFAQLEEKQKGWRQEIEDLDDRLNPLALALTADGELAVLSETWTCAEPYLKVTAPWLKEDELVDSQWWEAAPPLLRERVNEYTPAEFADDLRKTSNIPALVASGWPIQRAYAFLASDRKLGGQTLRPLPIYRTTAGEYCPATELALPAQINDPFHVRKLIDVGYMKGHEGLLERLALPVLDAKTYYGRLLPEFFQKHVGRRREVIEAIAQVYSRDDFPLAEWKSLTCAEDSKGKWVRPETLYWPNDLMTALFGDSYPQFASTHYKGRGVRPLMEALDMSMTVTDKDIVRELEQRAQESVTNLSVGVRQKVLSHALQASTTVLSTHLAKIKWLPDREGKGWYTPSELVQAEDAELVGHHLGNKRLCGIRLPDGEEFRRENRRALGFAHPQPEQVAQHIRDLNTRGQGPSLRILYWLNSQAGRVAEKTRGELRALKLFPLGDGTFAAATHLFREDPNLGRWRYRVGQNELTKFRPLIDILSIPSSPNPSTFRDVLLEIASQCVSGETPSKEAQDVAERCIRALSDAYAKNREGLKDILQSLRGKRVVPVVWKERTKGSLLRPEDALFVDKPADELAKFNLPQRIEVRTRDVASRGFFEELGVRSLSSVWKVTYDIPQGASRLLTEQNKKLKQMLPALLRLALKVHRSQLVNRPLAKVTIGRLG
ncbi:sacsin N-terminal ATP-binding-like domain-containing protein [Deinococcus hopiensis]|uniref:Sacsin/Nov domain-containing protein n=1 Tax=Deinococcus hopiensis KR-140 TaxID=695939 RepID=A0A1W1ULF0_9DEIO|nr:hypothetical protein [Deinococcus hopiensis]SMB81955.1 hypothetical protein SAMN00790413_04789 [Deinococcus hopiensis KR-140]